MRDTLAVVGAVDIHLAAAIGTVEQACEGSNFAPSIGVSSDLASDFLCKVESLLADNGFMGILENRPFVLRHIMAFLVLKVLSGLEIDGMTEIFTLFQQIDDSGRTPTVHILESLVFVHALIVLCKVGRGNEYLVLFQPVCDLIRSVAVNRHGKDTLDNLGGVFIDNPLVSCLVPEIAVNDRPCQMLACHAFGLESGLDFAACVSGVVFVHDVAKRGKIIVTSGTVHTVIDGNETDASLA